jgi:predicted  nucleic acid-binding Zn-ribbon protein
MSQFQTAIHRLERQIAAKQASIDDWRLRLAAASGPASANSLRSHITRAERDIEGYRAKIRQMQQAIERSKSR